MWLVNGITVVTRNSAYGGLLLRIVPVMFGMLLYCRGEMVWGVCGPLCSAVDLPLSHS